MSFSRTQDAPVSQPINLLGKGTSTTAESSQKQAPVRRRHQGLKRAVDFERRQAGLLQEVGKLVAALTEALGVDAVESALDKTLGGTLVSSISESNVPRL